MRTSLKTLVMMVAMLGLVGYALAEEQAGEGDKPKARGGVMGVVQSVDSTAKTIVVTVKGKEGAADTQVTVTTDENTKFKVNGKEGTLAEVQAGMKVKVSPKDGVAKMVTANSGEPKKDGEKKKDKAE
ncbi:MAG: hypothetical protein WD042_12610 [Phycisphaeraceae bacterium]